MTETQTAKWTIWAGIRQDNGEWAWSKVATRKWSGAGKAAARKLAREHQIKCDFADGRAIAFGFGDYEPSKATLVCNRNGNFYALGEVWP